MEKGGTMRRLAILAVLALAIGGLGTAEASHVVPGVSIPNTHETDFQTLFPSAPIAALGQLNYGPPCTDASDTLWCTFGAVGRFQSAVYAGTGSATGLYAYVYQQDCTGGLVDRTISHIPWSGAPVLPVFGAPFTYIATAWDVPQDYPPLPTTPFGGNLGVFNLSEFGQLGGTTGDGVVSAAGPGPGVYPDEISGDSGFGIFWSGTLLVAVTDRPPVVSHVTQEVPIGFGGISGDARVVALVPEGADPVDPNPNEWTIDLQLSPETAFRPVGSTHTVTAQATLLKYPASEPVVGGTVRFDVTGANTDSGDGTTGGDGSTTFTYTGANQGSDSIFGYLDLNNNFYHDGFEPADTVGVTWFPVYSEGYAARARVDQVPLDTAKIALSRQPGGTATNAIASQDVSSGTLSVGVGNTSAANDTSSSGASADGTAAVANVSIAGGAVKADLVTAKAHAAMSSGTFSSSGAGSAFVGLEVNSVPVSDSVPANTVITVPGVGTVTLREEIGASGASGASMLVNMIHFKSADGSIEVIVSSAFAGVGVFTAPPGATEILPPIPGGPGGVGVPPVVGCVTGEPIFTEGFEAGLGGFTTDNAAVWDSGAPTWATGPGAAAEGTKVAGTLVAGSTPSGTHGSLSTPTIDLSGFDPSTPGPCEGKKATLTFQSWYESYYYDCGYIEVSPDGGTTWTQVNPTPGYNWYYPYYCGGYFYPPNGQAFSAYGIDSWNAYSVDLTPFAGSAAVKVRFRFGAYYPYFGDDGWNLDDVKIVLS